MTEAAPKISFETCFVWALGDEFFTCFSHEFHSLSAGGIPRPVGISARLIVLFDSSHCDFHSILNSISTALNH